MTPSRQAHLDSLRGIAALIVVIVHYLAAFYPHTVFGIGGNYQQHTRWESITFFPPFGLLTSGHFAVCLFFILSGYVLSYSYLGEPRRTQNLLAAIIKRPIRLGGLVWVSIIVGSLFWYSGLFYNGPVSNLTSSQPWFSHFWAGSFNPSSFFVDLATSSFSKGNAYNPPLWTIKLELYGSMMVYLFLLLFGQSKYRLLIAIILLLVFKDSLYQGFWIGLIIADIIKNYTHRISLELSNTTYCLLFILFFYFSSYPHYVNQEFIRSTIYSFLPDDQGFGGGYPMLSAVLIFVLVASNNKIKGYLSLPVFQFFGHISYGLYTMHLLIIGSFSSWLFLRLNNLLGYNISFIIAVSIGFPIIVLAAYMSTKYVDNPSIRLANYIENKINRIDTALLIKNLYNTKKFITKRST